MFLGLFITHDSTGIARYKNLCSGIINVPLPYGMHLKVSPKGCHIFEWLRGFKCVEKSIDDTNLAYGFLKKKGRRSQYRVETGLWRNTHSWPKQIWSLGTWWRHLLLHGCCDVEGGLEETALQPWNFAQKILVGRVSPDARVTLCREIPGRFPGDRTIVP